MKIELRSGRKVYANCGIFGLEENDDGSLLVTEGYDGCVAWPPSEWEDDPLTADDMREIAWARFRATLTD